MPLKVEIKFKDDAPDELKMQFQRELRDDLERFMDRYLEYNLFAGYKMSMEE